MKTKIATLSLIPFLILAGCASSGSHSGSLTKYHAVIFAKLPPSQEPYQKEVAYTLANYGLPESADTNRTDTLQCVIKVEDRSVWNFNAKISLVDGNKVVAAASAVNPGFGNLLDSTGSIQRVFQSALGELENQLRKGGLHQNAQK